jgi:hypothetical protein
MFTRTLIAVALAAIASASFAAGEATDEIPQPATSTVSRADVQAVAVAARQAGLIAQGELSLVTEVTMGASQVTRAQVQAELSEARRLGLVGGGERTRVATPAQAEQIRLAGLAALMPVVAMR